MFILPARRTGRLPDLDVNWHGVIQFHGFSLPLSQGVLAKNVNCCVSQKACTHALSMLVLGFLLGLLGELWDWLALAQGWRVAAHLWHLVSSSSLGIFEQIV